MASRLVAFVTGKAPTRLAVALYDGSPLQSLFTAITVWPLLSVNWGSAIAVAMLNGARPSVGPIARISTVFAVEPPITKPTVSDVAVLICLSTETFTRRGVVALKLPPGVA